VISISKIKGVNDKISFSGRFKKGVNKKSNTITNVLYLLRKRNFFQKQAFKIDIQKNIPHGSGLGGGSSNAANVLNFFNSKMRLKLNKDEISKIAYQIGFDTPVSLEKKNTLLTGKKGEILRLNQKFKLNILIVYPNIICSTKKIYANNKKFTFFRPQSNFYIKNKNKLIDFLKNENNDLEKTAIKFYPKVRKIINFIKSQNGCYFSRITGSGSACIGIFSNMKSAVFAQKFMKLKFPNYWCVVSKTI
jgi:4-diphosphocytidyl-2-C-methyl-D-erythritol kinase